MRAMAARGKKPDGAEDPGFEERLEALEGIVKALEGEDLSLEESLARYQQGVEHLKACRALLDGAEKRLLELVQTPGGAVERPLRVGDDGLVADDDDAAPRRG
jgi:exodeoxyribonuclease VII small subunit